jgi:hypothetical protein
MQNKKTQLGRAQQCSILLEGNLGDGDIYIYRERESGYFAEIILAFQITRQIQKRGVVSLCMGSASKPHEINSALIRIWSPLFTMGFW